VDAVFNMVWYRLRACGVAMNVKPVLVRKRPFNTRLTPEVIAIINAQPVRSRFIERLVLAYAENLRFANEPPKRE